MQAGMKGESLRYYSKEASNLYWNPGVPINKPLTWQKLIFSRQDIKNAMNSSKPFISFVLQLKSMGKGQAFVNGNAIGRFWNIISGTKCLIPCFWFGPFNPKKCLTHCHQPSQEYYHVPADWVLNNDDKDIEVVLFDELGGDSTQVELVMLF
jgi:hypothetical protein